MSGQPVGKHVVTGAAVYQCEKTRMLFVLTEPQRRYVGTRDVAFGCEPPPPAPPKPPPCKPKKKK
jgi:hypothetical protein